MTSKRVLYYGAGGGSASALFSRLALVSGCRVRRDRGGPVVTRQGYSFAFTLRRDIPSMLGALHRDFFNLVLLDLRDDGRPGRSSRRPDAFSRGLQLLERMDQELDIERRYGFHRIIVLVSDSDAGDTDCRLASLGLHGVGCVLRETTGRRAARGGARSDAFACRLMDEIVRLVVHRRPGKTALCAAGGGITGLHFELGTIKCLEDCCTPGALNRLPLYFGISAGGVAVGMLANGYAISEFMASIAGVEGGRLPRVDLNLFDVAHLDFRGLAMPLRQVAVLAGRAASQLARGRLPFSLGSLVFDYGDLVHAPFHTGGFEAMLADSFSRPGCSNDFRALGHRLFIGATDQDRKVHVLFGDPPHDEVPVSRAIQASMSINPVFAPTMVGGRYYEDGAVTRTSNFTEAIARGADLIFTIDPFVPYVSKEPGSARTRGVFYNADQDLRTVSYTRYETARNFAIRRHPEVSLYTLLPTNNLRRLLSVNPMDHRPYLEIWKGAYLGTLRRLHTLEYRIRGDLAAHGVGFDTARADAIAERLSASESVTYDDFFVDGRVELPVPA
ncbi:MAG: patatin-like phospholipase family protein [Vicinamibacteraceae bacterium]|nr:patatin-like phospholipase family protein [Vicinamibacteraceae bacterium]